MSARGFKSVFMVGAIAGTALGCYMVSLRVASERAALESVENRIVLAQRDIRLLNTEIGTRGRLAQLERWNAKVIRLSAPSADQFVENSFQLATLAKPETRSAVEAPVVLASAPAPSRAAEPVVTSDDGDSGGAARPSRPLGEMIHVASYARPEPKVARVVAPAPAKALADKPATSAAAPAAKPAKATSATAATSQPRPAHAAKPVKTAAADPLGPLPGAAHGAKSAKPAGAVSAPRTTTKTTKDSGTHR